MATATQLQLNEPIKSVATWSQTGSDLQYEAEQLAQLCRISLDKLNTHLRDFNHTAIRSPDDVLALPFSRHRIPDILHSLPKRHSARQQLAAAIASLLYPVKEGSLAALIRYEADRTRLHGWVVVQRQYDRLLTTRRNGHTVAGMTGGVGPHVSAPVWADRVISQGPWDPERQPISLDGVRALPMPVRIADEEDLLPFMEHLALGGTHELQPEPSATNKEGESGAVSKGAEFEKGGIYEDGRMDMCKMVVGPDHITRLMNSLRTNTFVRHFLLGNNIIGPSGVKAIARFIEELPDRMHTWYIGGNCINSESLSVLVDALVQSPAMTSVWLKRNPLGPDAAKHLFKLITQSQNMHTLDLDQTELGDRGVTQLFGVLAAHNATTQLRHIYLNGTGISTGAVTAIGRFLNAPHCVLETLHLCANPLGDAGAEALAAALPTARSLRRLFVQSVGLTTRGAVALCHAVARHDGMRVFDLGQAIVTEDLKQAYNYIDDGAVDAIAEVLRSASKLEYFYIGHCPMSYEALRSLNAAVVDSPSLLYYEAISILPRPKTAAPHEATRNADAVQRHLAANVRARYGEDMTYERFMKEERRWVVSDRGVKFTDSEFRNRDAWMARRGLKPLAKRWEDGDETLDRVLNGTS